MMMKISPNGGGVALAAHPDKICRILEDLVVTCENFGEKYIFTQVNPQIILE
jgi:hypothetical protein